MKLNALFFATGVLYQSSVDALSTPKAPSFVSIPVAQAHIHRQSSIDPAIVHQQHANRGLRRLARMTGRAAPSNEELLSNILSKLSPETKRQLYQVHKYDLHAGVQLSARDNDATSSNHSIPLSIEDHDLAYYGTVKIGTPPRSFNLLMDSGSADFWVGGEGCRGDTGGGCGTHNFLGPKSSSSFVDTKQSWAITYNTGDVSGNLVTDHIAIANFKLKAFKFGVARNESEDFTPNEVPFDGILGLAKSSISRQGTKTIVEALKSQGLIKNAIVSYKIPREADQKKDGLITFGGMDSSKYDAASLVTLKNISPLGYWEADVGGFKVNGKDMKWSNKSAIFDTGTTLLLAPNKDVAAIHKYIEGAKFVDNSWTVPCTTQAKVSFTFGGKVFPIDSRDLAFIPVDDAKPKGDCWSGISGLPDDTPFVLVGDTFLKNVYLSTSIDKDEISIAKLKK